MPSGTSINSGRFTGGVISSGATPSGLHQALEQRGAGLAPAGAHPDAGDRFQLVEIGVPGPDKILDLAGSHPLAAAQDGIQGELFVGIG